MIKRNLLLLLQLLIILLIILAIARPFTRLRRTENHRTALILDVSASMATADGPDGLTRLQAAVEEAQRIVESLDSTADGVRSSRRTSPAWRPRKLEFLK